MSIYASNGPGLTLSVPVADTRQPGVLSPPVRLDAMSAFVVSQMQWLWDGYLGAGITTMLTSLWKAGKTTLVANLVRAMATGQKEFAGLGLKPVPTLIITEETLSLWQDRLGDVPKGAPLWFASRPFMGRPQPPEWKNYTMQLAQWCQRNGIRLVIVDPIANLIPGEENQAGAMLDFLLPLQAFSQAQCALLLLHHPRKSDGSEGRAARGSGALPGYVDVMLEMRRPPSTYHSRTRYITSYSRYQETLDELVLELSQDGLSYKRLPSKLASELSDIGRVVLALLVEKREAMTVNEMHKEWPLTAGDSPHPRALHNLLKMGLNRWWKREGEGTRSNPYRYRQIDKNGPAAVASTVDLTPEGAD